MTIAERIKRLREVEALEVAVLRAAIAWAPAGEKAAGAKVAIGRANQEVFAAQDAFNRALRAVEARDEALGTELFRLHNAGNLSRESVGSDGGALIRDVISASEALEKARTKEKEAQDASSAVHSASNVAWRDVLLALNAFTAAASYADASGLARLVDRVAQPEPSSIAEGCKERLRQLGEKV